MAAIFANTIRGLNICPHLFHGRFFFSDLTQQITLLTLSLLFFLAGILVTALKCNRFFLWVKWPGPKAVENNRSL